MRINRLGYRKKALLAANGQQVHQFLSSSDTWVSSALAKWIYEHATRWENPHTLSVVSLQRLRAANDDWINQYLWEEVLSRKSEDFADWILIALADRSPARIVEDIPALIDLYRDPLASLVVRGSAIFVINNRAEQMAWSNQAQANPKLWAEMQRVCEEALYDEENAYARAGACWLSRHFPGFESRLKELESDHTKTPNAGTVSDYAK
jgi:hypothetical protein